MISDARFDELVKRAWELSAHGPTEFQGMAFQAILHFLMANEPKPKPKPKRSSGG